MRRRNSIAMAVVVTRCLFRASPSPGGILGRPRDTGCTEKTNCAGSYDAVAGTNAVAGRAFATPASANRVMGAAPAARITSARC